MEHQVVSLPWRTVRLIAAVVVLVCVVGIVAILALAPRLGLGFAPEAVPQPADAGVPEGAERGLLVHPTTVLGVSPQASPSSTQGPSGALSPLPTFTMTAVPPTATPTHVPPPTETPTVTSTPAPTETPPPTETPLPTDTPAPTDTPMPTATPAPTQPPTPVPPLSMDWVLVEKHCITTAQWFLEFWITASGGTGEYTFYRDIERLHGPAPADGFGYQMYAGTGSAAVGTFFVESGTQRVGSEFWVARPDCSLFPPP